MEIRAKFKQQFAVIERNNFKSRKVWIITDYSSQYPNTVEIEVQGQNIDIFNAAVPDQEVTVHFNLRGREWTNPDVTKNPEGKAAVFNSIICWKVEGIVAVQQAASVAQQNAVAPASATATATATATGGLPF